MRAVKLENDWNFDWLIVNIDNRGHLVAQDKSTRFDSIPRLIFGHLLFFPLLHFCFKQ